MYLVQYQCIYREHWYDDGIFDLWNDAAARAMHLMAAGRAVRILLADSGQVVWAGRA